MTDPVESIQAYVLDPDHTGLHLHQLAEVMADQETSHFPAGSGEAWRDKTAHAAESVARFLYLVWGPSGPEEYAPRTYEMLLNLQRRMRGMTPHTAWEYALSTMGEDIRHRLRKAETITVDPDMETALTHAFFDGMDEHGYLHDVAAKLMDLHWARRHGPEAMTSEEAGGPRALSGPRGDPQMDRHLRRVAMEGLATYIEQSNIAWGNIDNPTEPTVLLRDRIEIQLGLGGKTAQTWEESARQIADLIERRFGTHAARAEARLARAAWRAAPHIHEDHLPQGPACDESSLI